MFKMYLKFFLVYANYELETRQPIIENQTLKYNHFV
jgi:hypothetical protein